MPINAQLFKQCRLRASQSFYNSSYFLLGLEANISSVCDIIYKKFRPNIIRHVCQNSGSYEDGEMIFQEALIIVIKKINSGELQKNLGVQFYSYLFGVCKNLWYKQLRNKKRLLKADGVDLTLLSITDDFDADSINEQKQQDELFAKAFQRLSEKDQRILKCYLEGKSVREIAEMFDTTEVTIRVRKYKLIKKIKRYVQVA